MTSIGYLGLFIALSCGTFAAAATAKRNNERYSDDLDRENTFEGEDILSPEYWWESKKKPEEVKLIEEEIMKDLSDMDSLQKHKIYDELKRQKVKSLADVDSLSPLDVAELKAVQKSIKTSDIVLPSIRNKRTLNFLLFAVARAMGYILVPRNPDAELLPLRSNPCRGNSPNPPPCAPPAPSSHHTTTTPPPPTIPPNQIDANTIRYPYRPSQQIPLLRFAPLPPGVNVPYPPLLQWPGTPPNPCSPPTKPPPPCPPPTKPPPPCPPPTKPPSPCPPPTKPAPPCPPPTKPPPPCPPPTKAPSPCPRPTKLAPPCLPPTKAQPSCCPPPSKAPSPPCKPNLCPAPPPEPGYKAPIPVPSPPPSPNSSKNTPLTLEYDYPVKIQIFNNGKKFLPASSTVYSGNPSTSKNNYQKLEQYEHLDEQGEKEDYSQLTGSNIFREDEERMPYEQGGYRDGQDEIREELFGNSRESEDEEELEDESLREERFYDKRVAPRQNRKIRKSKHNFIEATGKEREYFKTAKVHGGKVPAGEMPQKKIILKRVIVRKPTARLVDENGNEYSFATSAVHEVHKRDLQDFDFIRKYKETQGEHEDEHYRENENPPGRTTTSIKKIEVKKFIVNKSEDNPVEYHEKTERNSDEKPEKVTGPESQQLSEEEEEEVEDGGGGGGGVGGGERSSYNRYEPPQHEERREMENELARALENDEEEEQPPKMFDQHPPSGRGIKYVTKTITKYVGRGGGRETVKIVPIYKVVHAPPPPPRKIIHHHHHRVPVYPKIIVKTTGAVRRRPPPVIAHFGNAGNILLVTIRERSG